MQWSYGFDFGADALRMVSAGSDEILFEAAYAAFRPGEDAPFAWGDRAWSFLGRESQGIRLKQYMLGNLPAEPALTGRCMARLISLDERRLLGRKRALFALSPDTPEGTRDVALNAALQAGLDACGAVHADTAAALGCGLDVMAQKCCFILDIGARHMALSVLAGGRRIRRKSLMYGLDRADEAVRDAVRGQYGYIISPRQARILKHAAYAQAGTPLRASGLDVETRLPAYFEIDPASVQPCLNGVIAGLLEMCLAGLRELTPECAQDALERGLTLCGGGALLPGLDESLSESLNLPVHSDADPTEAVARGMKLIVDQSELYSPLIVDWREAGLKL
ncbi:MAG: rod shape-determining protein [Clostridia bacterium]|nr:rod shape-determining protein [Clostridia bacterium]